MRLAAIRRPSIASRLSSILEAKLHLFEAAQHLEELAVDEDRR